MKLNNYLGIFSSYQLNENKQVKNLKIQDTYTKDIIHEFPDVTKTVDFYVNWTDEDYLAKVDNHLYFVESRDLRKKLIRVMEVDSLTGSSFDLDHDVYFENGIYFGRFHGKFYSTTQNRLIKMNNKEITVVFFNTIEIKQNVILLG